MKCPNCELNMEPLKELSRGMGNQIFFKCPFCGTVALYSGDRLTQVWPTEGGAAECLVRESSLEAGTSSLPTAAVIKT